MAIPEEDLPPAWLRDYGDIEADISKMEEFAANLDAEVRQNYAPHLDYLREDVTAKIPDPALEFTELFDFLETHRAIQQDSTNVVFHYRDATGGFAQAAKEVSENYGKSDAFALARVKEVESALDKTSAARLPEPGTTPPPVTDNSGVS
ncbi:hypothetical protein [Micromonospora sp. NPDC004704]